MDPRRRCWLMRTAAAAILSLAVGRAAAAQVKTPRVKTTRVIEVVIENRRVVSPVGAIRATRGEAVELRVATDEPVVLHLHGYDQELRAAPGETASMIVVAHATGRFPLTNHRRGTGGHGHDALTYLEVYPR